MQCELGLFFVMHFQVTFLHALGQGEFAYVQGEFLCEFLARGLCAFGGICSFLEQVLSRMCRVVALA
jgi:hypothetical protein